MLWSRRARLAQLLVFATAAAVVLLLVRGAGKGRDEPFSLFGDDKATLLQEITKAWNLLLEAVNKKKKKETFFLKYPLFVNLGLLVGQGRQKGKATSLGGDAAAEVAYYMSLASAAYGAVFCAALGVEPTPPKDREPRKTWARAEESDVAAAAWGLAGVEPDVIVENQTGLPAHFVVSGNVLVVRGTRSVDDAASDLAARAVDFQGGNAHSGMLDAARRILRGPAAEVFLDNEQLVLCGHSLGAGVASLLALLVATDHPSKAVTCFAFAPPPTAHFPGVGVGGGDDETEMTKSPPLPRNCDIRAFVNANDCVPDLSLRSVAALLHKVHEVDALPLDLHARVKIIHSRRNHLADDLVGGKKKR
mmetsp:Transcript_1834/g.6176  ORF Transcript_1834/g.6176 Transcript_1834/m.6176 type:complete len:362 (-) Transcript_1834:1607-2692(-)